MKEAVNRYITAITWVLLHWNRKNARIENGLKRIGEAEDRLRELGVSEEAILRLIDLCALKAKGENLTPNEQKKIDKLVTT